MYAWHIFSWMSTIITFIFFIWFLKIPKLVQKDNPKYKDNYYCNDRYIYIPIGLRLWTVLLAILLSYIPILNIIGLIFMFCVVICMSSDEEDWNHVFDDHDNWILKTSRFFDKIGKFFNSEWFSKK